MGYITPRIETVEIEDLDILTVSSGEILEDDKEWGEISQKEEDIMKYVKPEMEIMKFECVPITQLSTGDVTSTVPGEDVPNNGVF